MDIDIELSKKLKSKYSYKEQECYFNAYDLFEKKEIDKLVIGYASASMGQSKAFTRHAWGVKNDKIIDVTFMSEMLVDAVYEDSFTINNDMEMLKAQFKTKNSMFEGFDDNAEMKAREKIMNKYNGVFI